MELNNSFIDANDLTSYDLKQSSSENDYILVTNEISKSYGGIKALDKVSIKIKRGEVHGLVGENGAGKSTFIKILTGATKPTSGEIFFDGTSFGELTPLKAMDLGVSAIYQELNLIPDLSIAENIFFGQEPTKGRINKKNGIFFDKKLMNNKAIEKFEELGIGINPKVPVRDLGIAYKQLVEIVKTISKNMKLIIMDEPSAPLTDNETILLHENVRKLQNRGVTIIYISHRLEEVFLICDRVSVLRDGHHISTKEVKETNRNDLISDMVGREMGEEYPQSNFSPGKPILQVKNLCTAKLRDISFELRENEILGLGGLLGAGRTDLARALFGADIQKSGTIYYKGNEIVIKSPLKAIQNGIGLLPEDRKGQGLIMDMDVKENITLPILKALSKFGFIDYQKERKICLSLVESLNIKIASLAQLVKNLSGGNQQKIVLSKVLATETDILIIDEPTRGIDVGAKQEIYKIMRDLVENGKSIIMISSELPELIGMSDRILVMRERKIVKELLPEEFSQETILSYATT